MDTLVFDIETSNFFTDADVGWNNFGALRISVVGVYSYLADRYECFEEFEMEELAKRFAGAAELVGFSMNHYDIPVLNLYFQKLRNSINLWEKKRVDLAEKIEGITGRRISLSRLAEANLGEKKDRKSEEAITLYKEGKIDKLKEYCLKDVRLTKCLYDLYCGQKYLVMPARNRGRSESGVAETIKVDFLAGSWYPPTSGAADTMSGRLFD